jgi:hypothetical protein
VRSGVGGGDGRGDAVEAAGEAGASAGGAVLLVGRVLLTGGCGKGREGKADGWRNGGAR